MFAIFKRKSTEDKLYEKYERLLMESHKLNTTSRIESERKYVEAQDILKQIEKLGPSQ